MRGRCLFNVSAPSQGVEVRITYTDPESPLHHIRIYRVDDELTTAAAEGSTEGTSIIDVDATDAALAASPFHEDLLSALSGSRVLRFCGWARIDHNDWHDNNFLPAWGGRTTPASLSQAGLRGVALEYMVSLANALNASAWFCMPRSSAMEGTSMNFPNRPGEATEEDLQTYARYVSEHLHPHLTAFVEYRTDAVRRARDCCLLPAACCLLPAACCLLPAGRRAFLLPTAAIAAAFS